MTVDLNIAHLVWYLWHCRMLPSSFPCHTWRLLTLASLTVIVCLQHFWSRKDSLQGICFLPILSSGFLHISINCMQTVLEIFHCITQQCSVVSNANREISFCHFSPDRHVSHMVLTLPVSHTTLDIMLSCLCGKLQTVNCEDTATLFQYQTSLSDKLRQIAEAEATTRGWW